LDIICKHISLKSWKQPSGRIVEPKSFVSSCQVFLIVVSFIYDSEKKFSRWDTVDLRSSEDHFDWSTLVDTNNLLYHYAINRLWTTLCKSLRRCILYRFSCIIHRVTVAIERFIDLPVRLRNNNQCGRPDRRWQTRVRIKI